MQLHNIISGSNSFLKVTFRLLVIKNVPYSDWCSILYAAYTTHFAEFHNVKFILPLVQRTCYLMTHILNIIHVFNNRKWETHFTHWVWVWWKRGILYVTHMIHISWIIKTSTGINPAFFKVILSTWHGFQGEEERGSSNINNIDPLS